jgi:hypothetical protein
MDILDEEGDFIRKSAVIGILVIVSVLFAGYAIGESSEKMFLHTNQHNTFEDYYSCVLTLYDGNGEMKWNITWDNILDKPSVISEKPVFDQKSIYLFVGEYLYSLDIESGSIIWKNKYGVEGSCDFQIHGEYIFLTEDFGEDVKKINKNTGQLIWSSSGSIKNYGSKIIGEIGDVIIVKYLDYDRCGIFDGDGNFITYKESNEIFDYFDKEKNYTVMSDHSEMIDSGNKISEIESGDEIHISVNNMVKRIEIHNEGEYRESGQLGTEIFLIINEDINLLISTNGDGIDTIAFSEEIEIKDIRIGIKDSNNKILISEINIY